MFTGMSTASTLNSHPFGNGATGPPCTNLCHGYSMTNKDPFCSPHCSGVFLAHYGQCLMSDCVRPVWLDHNGVAHECCGMTCSTRLKAQRHALANSRQPVGTPAGGSGKSKRSRKLATGSGQTRSSSTKAKKARKKQAKVDESDAESSCKSDWEESSSLSSSSLSSSSGSEQDLAGCVQSAGRRKKEIKKALGKPHRTSLRFAGDPSLFG